MVKSKKLIEMFRKWRRVAALGRRKILLTKLNDCRKSDAKCTTSIAAKGHFIVYSAEGKRFMIPLAYLRSHIFGELSDMSEEVFGLPGDGPITLPLDAAFIEIVLSLFRRRAVKDVEFQLTSYISVQRCAMSTLLPNQSSQLAAYGF